ncbi:chromogranin-A [Sebastes fasciatus]|uniref:chromogranin-A n=1 Tax=Sebastes fasciatus TaxID=394691 RepID=UPI003D9E966E
MSPNMIERGLLVLTILSNCVLSLPVTHSQLENEDVKVMKCIVEALADVLSRPHPMPVSRECLLTLKTDDRLVSILRHHNFLKELQEIAVQGGQERVQLQTDAGTHEPITQTPQAAGDVADRSMLEALGGPGERSILSQKRRTGNGDGEEEKDDVLRDGESREDNDVVEEKRENDESPGSHMSESVDEWSEGKAEKREEEEEDEEKRVNSEEDSEEENMIKDKQAAESGEKRDAPRIKSKEKKFDEEDEEEKDKRFGFFSHRPKPEEEEENDEEGMKRASKESVKRWTKRGKALPMKKKAVGEEAREVPHHSKEATEEEEEEEKKKRNMQRSPEEKELQMIARRGPEERRGSEEEGSASRKSEEPEIESLAAIESELENVAQKLHEMRRG